MIRMLLAISTVLLALSSPAQNQFLVSSDQNYFIYNDDTYRFIYTSENRQLINELRKYNSLFKAIYEKEFNWIFDEQATLVLASSNNQIANGFATTLPRLHTVYYGGGAEVIDEFSVGSWLYTLLSHETSHLYQLNIKRGYGQTLKKIFGPSEITGTAFLPPFTYTELSNAFLPTFMLEGNATYNESRFGNGGRLYSGASRALLLQLARNGDITMSRLMNDHLDFPFGREKYLIGGFFFLDLAKNYGAENTNRFFYVHADHKFNPFNVETPFIENFSINYETALKRFLEAWQPLYEKQISAAEKPLFTSVIHAGLSKDDNEIRTLTSTGRALPRAHIYNLQSQKWEARPVNMPMGKLFRNGNNKLIATSSETVNNHQVRAGLFAEGYSFQTKDLDKYFYDIRGPNKLWANAKTSFSAPDLYSNIKNNKALGASASTAIIGTDNEIYFFRQSGKTRTMMRGKAALFTFQGYYGFPIEINNGAVYFIGPAARGSALFYWQNGEFYRAHDSDTIIDARLINDSSALVTEITAAGYEYKTVALSPHKESPYEYTYPLEKEKNFHLLSDLHAATVSNDEADFKLNERSYSAFSQWQFDGVDPFIFFGVDTPAIATANLRFSDPLQSHALTLILSSGSFGEYGAGFQYTNSKYVVNWDFFNLFQKHATVEADPVKSNEYNVIERYDAWLAALGFNYLILHQPQWEVELSSHFVYQNEDPNISMSDVDKKYTLLTQLTTSNLVTAPLGYSPYKLFNLDLANEYVRTAPDWSDQRNVYGGEATVEYDIFRETYLSAIYQAAYTDSPYAIVLFENGLDDFPYPTPTQVYRNTVYQDQSYFEVRKVSAELKQALNLSLYFTKFPLSLRRLALFAQYHEYYGALLHHENPDTLFHEYGGGIELELLLVNKFPFRMRWENFKSSYADDASMTITLGANKDF